MIVPRKLSMQLTPLLDLLLIVIFAQYLEVQETQATVEEEAVTAVLERDVAIETLAQKEQELQQVREELETTLQQELVLAGQLQELFDLPEEEVREIFDRTRPPGRQTARDVERFKERFRQIAVEQSGRIVEHLLTYEEIRKRCDVWDVHIHPSNFLTLSSGNKTLQMQVPLDIDDDFVQQEFVERFAELAHTLPEPKSLVLLLQTYDRKSQRWAVQGVRETLPQVVQRLNAESAGRSRYDYADLGFRID